MISNTFRTESRAFLLSGLLSSLFSFTGCVGGDGLVDISGVVTFDGQPVSEGSILFRSTEGDQKAYAGSIAEGRYEVRVAPGNARVEILASRPVPGKFVEINPGEKDQVGEMYIPEKYNARSELLVDVEPGLSNKDFALASG